MNEIHIEPTHSCREPSDIRPKASEFAQLAETHRAKGVLSGLKHRFSEGQHMHLCIRGEQLGKRTLLKQQNLMLDLLRVEMANHSSQGQFAPTQLGCVIEEQNSNTSCQTNLTGAACFRVLEAEQGSTRK